MQAEIDTANPHHGPGAVGASTLQKALARIQGDKAERIMSKYTVSGAGMTDHGINLIVCSEACSEI